jgi:hypothetical protein
MGRSTEEDIVQERKTYRAWTVLQKARDRELEIVLACVAIGRSPRSARGVGSARYYT